MPFRSVACDFNDEGSAVYMTFPTGCLPEFAKTFHDGCRHKGKVILVLDRESKMLKVHTSSRYDVIHEEFKALADTHPTTDAAD